MTANKEMLDVFVQEINEIHASLVQVTNEQMKKKIFDSKLFEQYGQAIDRIYGTAMTLGFADLGKYTKAMKDVCYMCSQYNHEVGQKKVLRMMIECNDILKKIPECIYKTEEFKKYSRVFLVEVTKAERLGKIEFQDITRKSCA